MDKEAEKQKLTQEIESIMAAANQQIAKRQGKIELLDEQLKEELAEAYKEYEEEKKE